MILTTTVNDLNVRILNVFRTLVWPMLGFFQSIPKIRMSQALHVPLPRDVAAFMERTDCDKYEIAKA